MKTDQSAHVRRLIWVLVSITKTCLFKYIENFTPENWKFQIKNFDIFYIFAQNGRGGSNEYPQSIFMSRNKKNNVYLLLYEKGV